MTENQEHVAKGSIRKALNGEFDFDVKEVLKEGWRLTRQDKLAIWQGLLFVFGISMIMVAIAQDFSKQYGFDFNDPDVQISTQIILILLVAPFSAAIVMMGVNTSIGGSNKGGHIFQFVNKSLRIMVATVFMLALVQIGFVFMILPGFYMIIATGFTIPLVLDKGVLPGRAVVMSVKVVNYRWKKFVQIYLVFCSLSLLAVFTFGIAMLWILPFYYNVKGLLYRDIFGVGVEHQVYYPDSTKQSRQFMGSDKANQSDSADTNTTASQQTPGESGKDGFFDA